MDKKDEEWSSFFISLLGLLPGPEVASKTALRNQFQNLGYHSEVK